MMFPRTYLRNQYGTYYYPIYVRLSFWWLVSVVLAFAFRFLNSWLSGKSLFRLPSMFMLFLAVVLSMAGLYLIASGIMRNGGLVAYTWSELLAGDVRQALLNTMALKMRDARAVRVPSVVITVENEQLELKVSKLPGMHDLSLLVEDINSALVRGKYRGYAVVTSVTAQDGTYYDFLLEDVSLDRTFRPRTANDLIASPYLLKLQEGLEINLSKLPHIAIWGKSGSGKTTVLMSIIAQVLSSGSELLFLDGKTEFSSFSVFYPSEKIATDNSNVLRLLERVVSEVKQRQQVVADEVKRRNQLGLTGYNVGLKPIVIIGDEIGSIVAGMGSKEQKQFNALLTQLVQKGRSVSVFVILASQSPAVDVLPQGIRSQFSTRILLGSASGDVQRMAFGQAVTDGEVEKFQGFYLVDGLPNPQRFFVPNLITFDLENIETFQRLYEIGKSIFCISVHQCTH